MSTSSSDFSNKLKTLDAYSIEDMIESNSIEMVGITGKVRSCTYLGDNQFLVKAVKGDIIVHKMYSREQFITIADEYPLRSDAVKTDYQALHEHLSNLGYAQK